MCDRPTETPRQRRENEYAARRDGDFLNELSSLIARHSTDTVETSELVHVTHALDGSVIDTEDLHTVIEDLRAELYALRAAFEDYKKERSQ